MSKGFMMLALALCLVLLPAMVLSFRSIFRRLSKIDFVCSFLSISVGKLGSGGGALLTPGPVCEEVGLELLCCCGGLEARGSLPLSCCVAY
jgi:hypothetical protein